MNKKKVLVLIGSNSTEHDVSIVSGINIYNNIPDKYTKDIIYLDKQNSTFEIEKDFEGQEISFPYSVKTTKEIQDSIEYMQQYDIVFPALHGQFGEDGQIQHLFEDNNIKFVGCDSYTSNICFDKGLTKKILTGQGIKMAKTISLELDVDFVLNNINLETLKALDVKIKEQLKYPIFVKPAKSGSSVGVSKVSTYDDLPRAIRVAFNEDNKILLEEEVKGREIECAILEKNGEIIASRLGEIKPAQDFYTYDSKYVDKKEQAFLFNPNKNRKTAKQETEIQKVAKLIFEKLGCRDLSRVDFFLTKEGYVFNEINTMPGFTTISMYPQLLIASGYRYGQILEILIDNHLDN